MAQERKNPNCLICGSVNPASKKLCSAECKLIWTRKRQGYKGTAKPAQILPCLQCGVAMKPRSSNGVTGRSVYCSHKCYIAKLQGDKKLPREPKTDEQLAVSRLVMSERCALKRIARYIERPSRYIIGCACCSKSMVTMRSFGRPKSVCDECTHKAKIKHNRIAKARRRARIKGREHEAIDPLIVFERDGWQCYICQRMTPRELRGTYESLAPELEHVIPLSKGGTHTWSNVACSCRECNQAKSDCIKAA
jgi:5-methylcytosine-specific restriction endonuclease McrA